MEREILESDWKLLRELLPLALGRFCERVLAEVSPLAADASKSSHERYLAVFKLLHGRDEELADGGPTDVLQKFSSDGRADENLFLYNRFSAFQIYWPQDAQG